MGCSVSVTDSIHRIISEERTLISQQSSCHDSVEHPSCGSPTVAKSKQKSETSQTCSQHQVGNQAAEKHRRKHKLKPPQNGAKITRNDKTTPANHSDAKSSESQSSSTDVESSDKSCCESQADDRSMGFNEIRLGTPNEEPISSTSDSDVEVHTSTDASSPLDAKYTISSDQFSPTIEESDHDLHASTSTDVHISSSWADMAAKYRDVNSKCGKNYVDRFDLISSTPTPDMLKSSKLFELNAVKGQEKTDGDKNHTSQQQKVTEDDKSVSGTGASIATKADAIESSDTPENLCRAKMSGDVLTVAKSMMIDAIANAFVEVSSEGIENDDDPSSDIDVIASSGETTTGVDAHDHCGTKPIEVEKKEVTQSGSNTMNTGIARQSCTSEQHNDNQRLLETSLDGVQIPNGVDNKAGAERKANTTESSERQCEDGEQRSSSTKDKECTTNSQDNSTQSKAQEQILLVNNNETAKNEKRDALEENNKRTHVLNKGDSVTIVKQFSKSRSEKSKHVAEIVHGNNSNNAQIIPNTPTKPKSTESSGSTNTNGMKTKTAKRTAVKKTKSLNLSETSTTRNACNGAPERVRTNSESLKKRLANSGKMSQTTMSQVRAMSPLSKSIAYFPVKGEDADVKETAAPLAKMRVRHPAGGGGRTKIRTKTPTPKQSKDAVKHEGATSMSPAQMQLVDHNVNRFSTAAAVPLFPDGSRVSKTKSDTEI